MNDINKMTSITTNVFIDCILFNKKCPANSIKKNRKRLFWKQFKIKFPDGIITKADANSGFIQISKKFALNYYIWLDDYGFSEMSFLITKTDLLLKITPENESIFTEGIKVSPALIKKYIHKYPIQCDVELGKDKEILETVQVLLIVHAENFIHKYL